MVRVAQSQTAETKTSSRKVGALSVVPTALEEVSHNLNGQKLGRKGRVTRERILAVTTELLAEPLDSPVSLSEVARRAKLGMTSLYLYFSDLTELLLAVLEPVMAEAGPAYVEQLREHWPDDELEERSRSFVEAYFAFWAKNSRILHLRNSMADQTDERMMVCRVQSARPTIALLGSQLVGKGEPIDPEASAMASVLMTGIERSATVFTDPVTPVLMEPTFGPRVTRVIEPWTRLMVLAIRDSRIQSAG